MGAAGGAAAGAVVGAVGGPIGSAVGAVVGGVAGGLAGKGAAEAVNPTVEDAYWRENYATRPYVTPGSTYETYRPAYEYGWESVGQYGGRTFEEVELELSRNWDSEQTRLSWDRAREATRDAWDRAKNRRMPEDEDTDEY